MSNVYSIAGGIVAVSMVFVIVSYPNAVAVIQAIGNAFIDVILTASGQPKRRR